jgi:hypothetical protein
MKQELVRFLNPRRRSSAHQKIDISQADGRSSIAPEESNDFQFTLFRLLQRSNDVLRPSGSGQTNQQIAFPA